MTSDPHCMHAPRRPWAARLPPGLAGGPHCDRAPLERLAELTCGFRKQSAGAPIEDHGVLADHVEHVELAAAIALRHDFRIEPGVADAPGPDFGAQRHGRGLVDLVFAEFRVDGMHDHAVVLGGALDGDVVVLDILDDEVWLAFEWIAETAAAGRRAGEHIAFADWHVGED